MALTTSRPPDVTLNLLPSDVKSEQKTKRWFNIALSAAIAIVLILALITVVQRMQIAGQERTLKEEQAKAAALRTQVEALRPYELLKQSVDSSKAVLATALLGDIAWSRFLDDLDSNMPSDAYLNNLTVTAGSGVTALGEPTQGNAAYSGVVRTFPGLANWLDTFSGVEGLRFVYFSQGSKSEEGVAFSATAHVDDKMLSGRCQQEGSQCP